MNKKNERKITVSMAAKLTGLSPQFIRVCLQFGKLDIGIATKYTGEHQYMYCIIPSKLAGYMGITTDTLYELIHEMR